MNCAGMKCLGLMLIRTKPIQTPVRAYGRYLHCLSAPCLSRFHCLLPAQSDTVPCGPVRNLNSVCTVRD